MDKSTRNLVVYVGVSASPIPQQQCTQFAKAGFSLAHFFDGVYFSLVVAKASATMSCGCNRVVLSGGPVFCAGVYLALLDYPSGGFSLDLSLRSMTYCVKRV